MIYREVSRIQDILEGLLDVEEDMISNSNLSSREIFTSVAGVNEIFEAMLLSAHQYRRSHDLSLQNQDIEFSPWTISSGRHSVREAVVRQHHITSSRGLPVAEDGQQRAVLHSHLVSLADIVLSGYKQQLDSVCNSASLSARSDELTSAFKRHRTALITPILDAGLIDKAANLAEKYHDFGVLVELCDRKDDQDRLSQYMTDFATQGFSDFLFNWYLERGKYRKLLECASSNALAIADYNDRLAEFLSSHPKIAWLHQIRTGDFMAAHDTLQYLAAVESHSTNKKNNLLSLSKLSAVFSNESDEIIEQKVESISSQQALIRYQETLPGSVLEKLGMTVDNMPVFTVQKLIELYIGDENVASNEVDFKKALDLLEFLPQTMEDEPEEMDDELRSEQPDVEAIKHYIWCRILLKDSWENIDHSSNPLEACKHTVLSKTLDLAQDAGVLADYLPDVERLLEQEELGPIRESASSQYLIRARFEHVHRQLAAS
uniref:nuclear pore complex protein Nup133-like n=1 Tax=Styela clava TaxID=7725 RepID=UPI00193A86F1|nr:nuclear pore complex protein Nup133-like [Styela clava]